jgi:hypothetical protein
MASFLLVQCPFDQKVIKEKKVLLGGHENMGAKFESNY